MMAFFVVFVEIGQSLHFVSVLNGVGIRAETLCPLKPSAEIGLPAACKSHWLSHHCNFNKHRNRRCGRHHPCRLTLESLPSIVDVIGTFWKL